MSFLTTKGRLSRTPYIIFVIGSAILAYLYIKVTFFVLVSSLGDSIGSGILITTIVPIAIFSYIQIIIMGKRLHDIGKSAWLSLLTLLPLVGLLYSFYIMFMPGNRDGNQYGDAPTQKSLKRDIIGICGLIFLLGLSIVGIGAPSYIDNKKQEKQIDEEKITMIPSIKVKIDTLQGEIDLLSTNIKSEDKIIELDIDTISKNGTFYYIEDISDNYAEEYLSTFENTKKKIELYEKMYILYTNKYYRDVDTEGETIAYDKKELLKSNFKIFKEDIETIQILNFIHPEYYNIEVFPEMNDEENFIQKNLNFSNPTNIIEGLDKSRIMILLKQEQKDIEALKRSIIQDCSNDITDKCINDKNILLGKINLSNKVVYYYKMNIVKKK